CGRHVRNGGQIHLQFLLAKDRLSSRGNRMLGCKDRFKSFPAPQSVALPVNFREHASVGRDSVEPSLFTVIADVCGITDPGYRTQKKAAGFAGKPAARELTDYVDVSLPLENAQQPGCHQS